MCRRFGVSGGRWDESGLSGLNRRSGLSGRLLVGGCPCTVAASMYRNILIHLFYQNDSPFTRSGLNADTLSWPLRYAQARISKISWFSRRKPDSNLGSVGEVHSLNR